MKQVYLLSLFVVLLFLAGCSTDISTAGSNLDQNLNQEIEIGHEHIDLDTFPMQELSQEEIDGIIQMREEEKLARDVYLELYDVWGKKTFINIAQSEATHTLEVKDLIDRYGLEDPVTADVRGEFVSQEISALYEDLVSQGSESLLDALIVGATVEDLDIYDLDNLMLTADNEDILYVYDNLKAGSKNHLRSFTRQIISEGGEYTPMYISQETYEEILLTPHTGSGLKGE